MESNGKPRAGLWWAVGGAALGTVLGLFFAPKRGSELRNDVGAWGRRQRDGTRGLMTRLASLLAFRSRRSVDGSGNGGPKAGRAPKESHKLDGGRN